MATFLLILIAMSFAIVIILKRVILLDPSFFDKLIDRNSPGSYDVTTLLWEGWRIVINTVLSLGRNLSR